MASASSLTVCEEVSPLAVLDVHDTVLEAEAAVSSAEPEWSGATPGFSASFFFFSCIMYSETEHFDSLM